MARRFGEAGRKMTMAFTVPFGAAVGGALKASGQFQKSMALVEVAAQRAGEDTTQLREDMRDLALQMSKNTIFTVDQTSDAMLELARAGIVTAKEMANTLPAALDLATAGELDTATATVGLVNVLKQFELGADQATRASDALAQGAVVSTADVKDMIQAFSFVGPLAREMGLSLEDAGVAISIMSDRGLRGGRAGRGLRQILKSLVDPSKEASGELRDLGISIGDSEGKIRPFVDIMEDLRQALFEEGEVTRTVNSRHAITAKQLEKANKISSEYELNLQKLNLRLQAAEGRGGRAKSADRLAGAQASIIQARQNIDKLNASYAAAQRVIAQASGSLESQVTILRKLTPEQREQKLATIFSARALSGVIPLIRAGKEGWEKYVQEISRSATAHDQATKVSDTLIGVLQRMRNIIEVLSIETILPFVEDRLVPLIKRLNEWLASIETLNPKLVEFGLTVGGIAATMGPMLLVGSQFLRILGLFASPLGAVTVGLALLAGLLVINRDAIKDWANDALRGSKTGIRISRAMSIFQASMESGESIFTSSAAALTAFGPAGTKAMEGVIGVRDKWNEFIEALETGRPSTAAVRLEELFTLIGDLIGPHIDKLKKKFLDKSGEMWEDVGTWWSEKGGKELVKGFVAIGDVVIAAFIRNVLRPFSQLIFRAGTGLMDAFLDGIMTGDFEGSFSKFFNEIGDVVQLPKTAKALKDWQKESEEDWDKVMPLLRMRIRIIWRRTLMDAFGTFDYSEITVVIAKGFVDAVIGGVKELYAPLKKAIDDDLEKIKEKLGLLWFNLGKSWAAQIIAGIVKGLEALATILQGAAPGGGGAPSSGFGGGGIPGSEVPAGVVPGAQFGGTFMAARPTLLAVGEGGPEVISVAPVRGLGQSQGGTSLTLEIGTLIGDRQSIDLMVGKVRDLLQRDQRHAQVRLA